MSASTAGGSAAPPFVLHLTFESDRVVVEVRGLVDLRSAADLDAVADAVSLGQARLTVVDLGAAYFFDDAGLGLLVGATTRLAAGHRVRLVNAPPVVQRVFELAGLDHHVGISDAAGTARPKTTSPTEPPPEESEL